MTKVHESGFSFFCRFVRKGCEGWYVVQENMGLQLSHSACVQFYGSCESVTVHSSISVALASEPRFIPLRDLFGKVVDELGFACVAVI